MTQQQIAERYVETAGIKARILEEGAGTPVFLFHGGALGSSANVWERNLPVLADAGLRGIAVDLPAYGRTEVPPEFTLAYRRSFVLGLMDALGLEKAGLIGHSSAGSLVVSLALENADRLLGVMVLGTGSLLPPLPDGEAGGGGDDGPQGREPTIDDARAVLEEQLFDHSLITAEVVEARWRMRAARLTDEQRARSRADRAADAAQGVPLRERLAQIKVPFMMMYGADDRPTTAKQVGLLRQRYPRLDVRLLSHCRHIIQWDRADAFNTAATTFFNR
jgi:pimeloyl-ACP methyl ester carboxylesterase